MIIANKIKTTKLIINLVVLILTYFFSFHIFPKLSVYNKLDYKGIEVNGKIFSINLNLSNYLNNTLALNNIDYKSNFKIIQKTNAEKNRFLLQYLKYFNNNKNLISDAPCPKELLADNLRNIQIYDDDSIDVLTDNLKFNVRFSFYKFFESSEKLDINKCFDYIFKENLNKYFLLYRDKLIRKIHNQIIDITNLEGSNHYLENSKDIKNLSLSTFLEEVEKGNVVSVVFRKNDIDASFANGTIFKTYYPPSYFPNLVEKFSSKGVSFSVAPAISYKNNELFDLSKKISNMFLATKYFVDPNNASYTITQQANYKSYAKILTFAICLFIIVYINIIFNKLSREQISKFIKIFIFK